MATFTDNDLSVGWTEIGAPDFVDDQHAVGTAFSGDGIDNQLERPAEITAGTTKHSVKFWFKMPSSHSANGVMVAQNINAATDTGLFHVSAHSTGRITARFIGTTNANALISQTLTAYKDDLWHRCVVVARSSSDLDIFVDATEGSYNVQDQVIGLGFNATVNGSAKLSVGNFDSASSSNEFFDGLVSRITLCEDIALLSGQISDDLIEQCGDAFVPTPAGTSDDMSSGDFSQAGSPVFVDDLWNSGTAFLHDGVDDILTWTAEKMAAGVTGTFSMQVNHSSGDTNLITQTPSSGTKEWELRSIQISSSIRLRLIDNASSVRLQTRGKTRNNDVWTMHTVVINSATSADLYVDGVEDTYFEHNLINGAGWSGFDPSTQNAIRFDGTELAGSLITRPRRWDEALSPCQVLKLFNNEIAAINVPPVLDNPIPDQAATEDILFDFTFAEDTFSDPNLDALTYSATSSDGSVLPAWLTFNPAIRRFLGTPGNDDVGIHYLRVGADDSKAAVVYSHFVVTVTNVNSDPVVDNVIPDQVATANNDFNFIFAEDTFDNPDKIPQIVELLRTPLDEDTQMVLSRDISGNNLVGTWMSNVTMVSEKSSKITFDNPGSLQFVPPAYIDFGVVASLDSLVHTWSAGLFHKPDVITGADILIGHVDTASRGWAISRDGTELTLNRWGVSDLTTTGATLIAGIYYFIGVAILANGDVRFYAYGSDDSVFIETVSAGATDILPTSGLAFRFGSPVSADTIGGLLDYVHVWPRIINDAEFEILGEGALLPPPTLSSEPLTYSAALSNGDPLPDWLIFNPVTREFSGIPTDANVGSLEIKVVADDGGA